ncbi:MAG: tetratricopeptide repeat protein [Saprospiraceae bacterium]
MKFILILILISGMFYSVPISGQTNFREIYETSNPVSKDSTFTYDQKIKIHQAFLDSATRDKNQLNQLLGNLYIFMDYTLDDEFAEATPYILEAKKIALESENEGWLGWVNYRAGILYIRIRQEDKAIETYESAAELCREAGDSLCLGESLEQLSAMKSLDGEYELAEEYFKQALPLLKKYGEEKSIATAMSNYGNLQVMNGQMEKGIPYIERAMKMHQKSNRLRHEGKALNNLATASRRLGEYDKSIEFLKKAIKLNKEHQFFQNLIKNYMGMFISYEGKNDFKMANEFLLKRYTLKDSLIGIETQLEIEELNKKYETERIKSDLQKKEIDLIIAQRRLERGGVLLFLIILLAALGIWKWKIQTKINRQKLEESKENLKRMTRMLFEKNSLITNLEEEKKAIEVSK